LVNEPQFIIFQLFSSIKDFALNGKSREPRGRINDLLGSIVVTHVALPEGQMKLSPGLNIVPRLEDVLWGKMNSTLSLEKCRELR
jgi:hypothetical protein